MVVGGLQGESANQEFANLTAELLVGQRGPEVQMEGMPIGVKMEKPDNFDGSKSKDVNTWIFQVHEHLALTVIPEHDQVPYATSLLRVNAAMWWRELCEHNQRLVNWDALSVL